MRSLHVVLSSPPDPLPIASCEQWWQRHRAGAGLTASSVDQAILGGFSADRAGYAFASGYQAALRALIPDLPPDRVASLCVTERGGGHQSPAHARWERDKLILSVAGAVREKRLERAWENLVVGRPASTSLPRA